ncbi:unnamed protein product [Blumeria hordei]|uniref:Uncharacterized protein n=2 Tax=Blumeria hordei TaxID=2867405 RepID=A0A383US02_BLUHO|nr:hypothetical protein BGHDH14_bgh04462 [Blumeria hordei DH14]SZF02478.1 unnamed protein product [Blumeria hordei]
MNIDGWSSVPPAYSTVDRLLDDVFMHMATCDFSTYPPEKLQAPKVMVDTHVGKSSPTKNKRASFGRRKTLLDDGVYRRRLALTEQNAVKPGPSKISHSQKIHRPVSWHSTPLVTQHLQESPTFTGSSCDGTTPYSYSHNMPTTTSFSQTPPHIYDTRSTMPTDKYQAPTYSYQDTAPFFPFTPIYPQSQPYEVIPQPGSCDSCLPLTADALHPFQINWANFPLQNMDHLVTTPPTPHDLNPHQQVYPFPQEDIISSNQHPLSDEDNGGEELIGMGLYDNPEPCKTISSDLSFDDYQSCFMSHLTGNSRGQFLCSPGKGLKLEETWSPPMDNDGDDDDGDTSDEGQDDDVTSDVGQDDEEMVAVAVNGVLSPTMSQAGRSYFSPQGWT